MKQIRITFILLDRTEESPGFNLTPKVSFVKSKAYNALAVPPDFALAKKHGVSIIIPNNISLDCKKGL